MNYENKLKQLLSKLHVKTRVRFALDCALDVKHLIINPLSLKVLEITALWLEDKATIEEVQAANAAAYAAAYAVYAASYAANAAYFANSAAFFHSDPIYAAYSAAFNAAKALNLPIEHYYTKLINSLSEVEKVIYNISDTA